MCRQRLRVLSGRDFFFVASIMTFGVVAVGITAEPVSHAERDVAGAKLSLGAKPVTVELPWNDQMREAAHASLADKAESSTRSRFQLRVSGLHPEQPSWNGGRVFVNLPGDPKHLDPAQLTPQSPYYAGSFAFFPKSGVEQAFYLPNVDQVLRKQAQANKFDYTKPLRVTIVGIPGSTPKETEVVKAGATVPFKEVSLHVGHANPRDE